MKLLDAVQRLHAENPAVNIKVGATNGTGYFFAGTCDEFLSIVNDIDEELYPYVKEAATTSKAALDRAIGENNRQTFEAKEQERVDKENKRRKEKRDSNNEERDELIKKGKAKAKRKGFTKTAIETRIKSIKAEYKNYNRKYADIKPDFSEEHFKSYKKTMKRRIASCRDNYELRRDYFENYVKLKDRVIKDKFVADKAVDYAIVFMVDGIELGKYWTYDERKRGLPAFALGLWHEDDKGMKGQQAAA